MTVATIDIERIVDRLLWADVIEDNEVYTLHDPFYFAQIVIALTTGVDENTVADTEQIARVRDAAFAKMHQDTNREFWTGERLYHSGNLDFVEAAVLAV